jgi:hypothetical protein
MLDKTQSVYVSNVLSKILLSNFDYYLKIKDVFAERADSQFLFISFIQN